MAKNSVLFTSESVSEGHPDKVCDQISDAILDEALRQDRMSRVACECFATTGLVVVGGEITTKAIFDVQEIVRRVVREIGYTKTGIGFDADGCAVMSTIHRQSPDIAMGVDEKKGHEQGAGDQGMMFGFACDETPELMPLPITLAHKLVKKLAAIRKSNRLKYLRPDSKSQVTVEYVNNKPKRIHTVVVSTQHDEKVSQTQIKRDLTRLLILPTLPKRLVDKNLIIHVNPTGRFVVGGPHGDTGLTGRKIIVDTYGGMGRHGGGAFSGKDPSKVDRSAAYAMRWIAKNVVAAGLAKRCEVQVSYAIGVARPISLNIDTVLNIDTQGTGRVEDAKIRNFILKNVDLSPAGIIRDLKLRQPIYRATAAYGHFGRNEKSFTWEKTNLVPMFKRLLK